MNITDLKDIVFSMTYNSGNSQELNFEFIYNLYQENETNTIDNIILDKSTLRKNKFIRINLEKESDSNLHNTFLSQDSQISFLRDLVNIDLYESERELFNKLDNIVPSRYHLTTDYKNKEIRDFFKIHKSSKSNLDETKISSLDRSNTLSILPIDQYKSNFIRKDLPEEFNHNNIKDYEKIINNEKAVEARKQKNSFVDNFESGELLPSLNYVSKSINTGDFETYSKLNAMYCGSYIEKFVKEDEKYKFLCSKFYILDKSNRINKVEDQAIKYGKTYRYVHYNVYLYTTVDIENRFVLKHYIVCDYPYLSNDIVCRENMIPPEPVGVSASYDKINKKMMLNWQSPTNYQGDVKGYQILKRFSLEEPFKLVKQLEGHLVSDLYEFNENVSEAERVKTPGYVNTKYFDKDFDPNRMCIYAIRSIDAHGMVSNYSEQVGVYYDFLRDDLVTNLVARAGAEASYPNSKVLNKSLFFENITDVIDNLPICSQPKKITLYATPDFVYTTSDEEESKTMSGEYQFTFMNLNSKVFRSDKFTINNFG
jgi:hypothetical protein